MLNATVAKRIDISNGLAIFQVKPDGGVPPFEPGQYITLALPGSAPRPAHFPPEATPPDAEKLIKRPYSISSPPSEKEFVELYLALLPEGLLTSRLASLKEGDRLWSSPKIVGTFTTKHVSPTSNLIFISTGTGIAPYMAMVRHRDFWIPDRQITIVHGARYPADLAYRSELEQLAASNPRFKYVNILSRADSSWSGNKGYVQHLFERGVVPAVASTDQIFLCGNPAMIKDVTGVLGPRGFTVHTKAHPGNIHVEEYW